MTVTIPEEGSHWYKPDGTPCHTVPKKDGKGDRAVSLRWDRRLGLFPSVTNIINIKSKPGLDVYKLNQAITSCLTLPRIENESEDDFAKRVVVDMDAHRKAAGIFGDKVHKATEAIHLALKYDQVMPRDSEVEPYIADYREWLLDYSLDVLEAESVMVNDVMGYAGTTDLLLIRRSDKRLVYLDTKTQNEKVDQKGKVLKLKTYDTWLLQLRAYASQRILEKPLLVSAIINSSRPAPAVIHEWPEVDYQGAYRAFCACHYLWCWSNDYWPTRFWAK